MNIVTDVHDVHDLDRWVEHKLGEYNLQPTPERKLIFLQGAKEALDRVQGTTYENEHHIHVRNLVIAMILRLRVEKHTHPTLF